MSRVLRRPMFRGGIADSEGVGITSGLDTPRKKYAEPDEENNYSFVQQNDTYNPLAYNSETESQSDRLRRMREESDKKIRDYNEQVKTERQQTTENINQTKFFKKWGTFPTTDGYGFVKPIPSNKNKMKYDIFNNTSDFI